MEIRAEKFKIEMTHEDLWNTAFDVRRAMEHTLKTHWINHQSAWEKNEIERLNRCKNMFTALGRPELYEEIFTTAKEVFEKFNEAIKP